MKPKPSVNKLQTPKHCHKDSHVVQLLKEVVFFLSFVLSLFPFKEHFSLRITFHSARITYTLTIVVIRANHRVLRTWLPPS